MFNRGQAVIIITIQLLVLPLILLTVVAQDNYDDDTLAGYVFYVDKNNISGECSDSNVGNLTEPFCTINRAIDTNMGSAQDVDVIVYVRAATYYQGMDYYDSLYWDGVSIPEENGSSLYLRNYPDDKVVLNALGMGSGLMVMGGNITIEGFEITNFSHQGITVDNYNFGEAGVNILNNNIHGCASETGLCSGIHVIEGSADVISGNEIYNMPSEQLSEGGGIIYHGSDAVIEKNVAHDNKNNGIHVEGESNTIRNNTLYDNSNNIQLRSCHGCAVSDNLVYSTSGQTGRGINIVESPGTTVSGNTVAFTPGFGIRITDWSSGCEMKNNIVYGSGEGALFFEFDGNYVAGASFASDYNLFHSVSDSPIYFMGREYGDDIPDQTLNHYKDESGQDAHSMFHAETVFVAAESHDFHPQEGSPVCGMAEDGSYIGALPCAASAEEPTGNEPEPPCVPDWECTEWSQCINEIHGRDCFDWNECNTSKHKPNETEHCTGISIEPPVNDSTGIPDNESIANATEPEPTKYEPDITVIMPEIDDTAAEGGIHERPEVIEKYSSNQIEIRPEQPAVFNIQKPKIGVNRIKINVKEEVTGVIINVARISRKPPEIIPNATGVVYQYLNITHDNLTSHDIDLINIYFDVNKTWALENRINKSDVYLSRFVANQWTRLPTRLIKESGDMIQYKAISPGLSIFSIMAGSVLAGTNRTCVSFDLKCEDNRLLQCDNSGMAWNVREMCEHGCSETTGCLDSQSDGGAGSPWTIMIVIIVIILVLGLAGAYFSSKRERLTEEIKEMKSS